MAQIDSRLGDMIRSYREKLGLTQEEMAERLQVNLTHYGNIERAACNPSFSLVLCQDLVQVKMRFSSS